MHEKVILLGRSRLRALVGLVFAHDMQIQVAHALCKQGCRLISNTAYKRIVTIEACYNNIVPGLPYQSKVEGRQSDYNCMTLAMTSTANDHQGDPSK